MPFSTLGLSTPLVQAITELGYQTPTPIQEQAIPAILSGKDLIATAQTGTGKTAAFVLPLLERFSNAEALRAKRIRALILVPTRELAVQVNASVAQYAKHTQLTSMAAYGGVDTAPQKERLIEGVDILVATPGRLLALASLPARRLQQVIGHAHMVGVAFVRRRSIHLGGHSALEIGHFLRALIDQQGIQLDLGIRRRHGLADMLQQRGFPAPGGTTISPRCPMPMGVIKSIARTLCSRTPLAR